MHACFDFAAKKLQPQFEPIAKAFKENARKENRGDVVPEGQFNTVQWILNHEPEPEKVNAKDMARTQMSIAFVAIHTTGLRAINAIFDIASYPEYAAELREEYEQVLKEEGTADGQFTKTGLAKLKKMDSFLLESSRCNPSGLSECSVLNIRK